MPQDPDHASPSSASSGDENDDSMVKTEGRPDGKTMSSSSSTIKNKDPSRPKRKKARRACHACQRAHLTCGDERPCQRCVKRGLADSCQDGARKKAKYLHDTPAEALIPGNSAKYLHQQQQQQQQQQPQQQQQNGTNGEVPPHDHAERRASAAFASQPFTATPSFAHASPHHQMMGTMQDQSPFSAYASNQSPVNAQYSPHQPSPMQGVASSLQPQHSAAGAASHYPSQGLNFDQDSTMFNFDLASMNFGNHYGAMEFGMLGHMASGANDPAFSVPQRPHSASTGGFDDFGAGFVDNQNDVMFNGDASWPGGQKMAMHGHFHPTADGQAPNAFAIGAGPGSISGSSPRSNTDLQSYENGSLLSQTPQQATLDPQASLKQRRSSKSSASNAPKVSSSTSSSAALPQDRDKPQESISKKLSAHQVYLPVGNRSRNSAAIYSRATKPYPYTSAFHALTAVLKRRFPTSKRLAIAKALATIRPSFISCARDLVDEDLVFMEKCFQRGLYDYEDFQHDVCTPTIICRRTGEVAHVTKEFCIMSGWNRDVLLGKKPNRNANIPMPPESGQLSATSSRGGYTTPSKGHNTPAAPLRNESDESGARQQPVFLAELLDDDSVVKFYEDYAKLAFADSKGSIRRRCQVLKYTTKEDVTARALKNHGGSATAGAGPADSSTSPASKDAKRHRKGVPSEVSARNGIFNEEGMRNLGARDGRVDCMYCWQVKRDVFNIPMMIVLNFLPIT